MSDHGRGFGNEIVDLVGGRPGWRLEPRSTPGATPLWCFVFGGKIEFSVTADGDSIHLYVMETDEEILFNDTDELTKWLRTHRAEALREPAARPPSGKSRFRKLFEWK
jgi:hypothetical protein